MRLGVGNTSPDQPAPLLIGDAWDIPFQRGPRDTPSLMRASGPDSVESSTFSRQARRQRRPSNSLQTAASISSHSSASRSTVGASRSGYSTVR